MLQSIIGEELPLGDLGFTDTNVLLDNLPRGFVVDRYSGKGIFICFEDYTIGNSCHVF